MSFYLPTQVIVNSNFSPSATTSLLNPVLKIYNILLKMINETTLEGATAQG
jgi:hypothetical protein